MKFDDEEILKYYWEENDNQDGTFFNSYEKINLIDDDVEIDDTFDADLEEKKWRAVLYLRSNKELLNDKIYQKVYNRIIDEYIREFEYRANDRHKVFITEDDREHENVVIDCKIKEIGKKRISKYKNEALYIIDFMTDLNTK